MCSGEYGSVVCCWRQHGCLPRIFSFGAGCIKGEESLCLLADPEIKLNMKVHAWTKKQDPERMKKDP